MLGLKVSFSYISPQNFGSKWFSKGVNGEEEKIAKEGIGVLAYNVIVHLMQKKSAFMCMVGMQGF